MLIKWAALYASEFLFPSPMSTCLLLFFWSPWIPFVCSLLLRKQCAGCRSEICFSEGDRKCADERWETELASQCCWECAQRAVDKFKFGVNAWWVYHCRQSPLNWIWSIVHRTISISAASTYFQIHCSLKQHRAHFAKHQLLKHNLRSYINLSLCLNEPKLAFWQVLGSVCLCRVTTLEDIHLPDIDRKICENKNMLKDGFACIKLMFIGR